MEYPITQERQDYRGYVRATAWHSAKVQREALLARGVPLRAIYTDGRGSLDERDSVIRSLRHGDTLVVYALFTLASNRRDLLEVLEQVQAKRASLMDARDGEVVDPDAGATAVAKVSEAITDWAGEKYNPDKRIAAEKGRKGARPGKPRVQRDMGKREAGKVWRGPGTERERLERMPGWSRAAAYRAFGKRGQK